MLSKDLRDLILKALTTVNEASCRESRKFVRERCAAKTFRRIGQQSAVRRANSSRRRTRFCLKIERVGA